MTHTNGDYKVKVMEIKYLELKKVTAMYADEIHEAVNDVINGGW